MLAFQKIIPEALKRVSKIQTPYLQFKRTQVCVGHSQEKGIILGVYSDPDDVKGASFTQTALDFDKESGGKMSHALHVAGTIPKLGEYRLLLETHPGFSVVAMAGLGPECVGYNEVEDMDEEKENIRIATSVGARGLQNIGIRSIMTESMGSAESAAEGTALGVWVFQEMKEVKRQIPIPGIGLYDSCDYTGWQIGLQKASAQNLARQLSEIPSNILTPIGFAQSSVDILAKAGVSVEVKVKAWAKIMDLNAFLAAGSGSCEPPVFVELSYYGCEPDTPPLVLIGKGVTFNSGGLCLKTCEEQKDMRGDKSGAAVVVGAMRAASALNLPMNIRGIIPLTENMPGPCAVKPGDVIRSKSGKTIVVEDTDFDGRLMLADAMTYAGIYNPKAIISIGTVAKNTIEGLGGGATAGFSNNESMIDQFRIAGIHTGDRVWRFPLWKHYNCKVLASHVADSGDNDIARSYGDPCASAAFLREFLPPGVDWVHLDNYGTYHTDGTDIPYLRGPGMTGRPTRTLIEFLAQAACKYDEGAEDTIIDDKKVCADNSHVTGVGA
uniref:Cytosol aminopeptidase n=3 Tax=Lygus hesperus TaxID=30085 RepID=A0A0A9YVE0_LYGHE